MQNQQIRNKSTFNINDWSQLYFESGSRVLQNKFDPHIQIQEYPFVVSNRKELQLVLQLFQIRHQHSCLINIYHYQIFTQHRPGCQDAFSGLLYSQRIPLRLAQTIKLDLADFLHTITKAVEGFEKLTCYFNYFKIKDNFLGVNLNKTVKVWHNQNYSCIYPFQSVPNQQEMVLSILATLESLTDFQKMPKQQPNFKLFAERNSHKLSFQTLKSKIMEYSSLYNNGNIPNKLQLVEISRKFQAKTSNQLRSSHRLTFNQNDRPIQVQQTNANSSYHPHVQNTIYKSNVNSPAQYVYQNPPKLTPNFGATNNEINSTFNYNHLNHQTLAFDQTLKRCQPNYNVSYPFVYQNNNINYNAKQRPVSHMSMNATSSNPVSYQHNVYSHQPAHVMNQQYYLMNNRQKFSEAHLHQPGRYFNQNNLQNSLNMHHNGPPHYQQSNHLPIHNPPNHNVTLKPVPNQNYPHAGMNKSMFSNLSSKSVQNLSKPRQNNKINIYNQNTSREVSQGKNRSRSYSSYLKPLFADQQVYAHNYSISQFKPNSQRLRIQPLNIGSLPQSLQYSSGYQQTNNIRNSQNQVNNNNKILNLVDIKRSVQGVQFKNNSALNNNFVHNEAKNKLNITYQKSSSNLNQNLTRLNQNITKSKQNQKKQELQKMIQVCQNSLSFLQHRNNNSLKNPRTQESSQLKASTNSQNFVNNTQSKEKKQKLHETPIVESFKNKLHCRYETDQQQYVDTIDPNYLKQNVDKKHKLKNFGDVSIVNSYTTIGLSGNKRQQSDRFPYDYKQTQSINTSLRNFTHNFSTDQFSQVIDLSSNLDFKLSGNRNYKKQVLNQNKNMQAVETQIMDNKYMTDSKVFDYIQPRPEEGGFSSLQLMEKIRIKQTTNDGNLGSVAKQGQKQTQNQMGQNGQKSPVRSGSKQFNKDVANLGFQINRSQQSSRSGTPSQRTKNSSIINNNNANLWTPNNFDPSPIQAKFQSIRQSQKVYQDFIQQYGEKKHKENQNLQISFDNQANKIYTHGHSSNMYGSDNKIQIKKQNYQVNQEFQPMYSYTKIAEYGQYGYPFSTYYPKNVDIGKHSLINKEEYEQKEQETGNRKGSFKIQLYKSQTPNSNQNLNQSYNLQFDPEILADLQSRVYDKIKESP